MTMGMTREETGEGAMSLRRRFREPGITVAPGCYDALSALMIERAGFAAAYLSGANIAYTRLGRSDIGLVSMTEVADAAGVIRERVTLPLIVDCDTGFGNALNVVRMVKLMARRGASALQLEDQTMPKRCGHLAEKRLVPTGEMVGKIKAALDARPGPELLVIARTDAIAVEGYAAALERAEAYRQAGADMLFVEAPRTRDQLGAVAAALQGRAPLMANMVEGGQTPILSGPELEALGFALVIFPGAIVRALARAAQDFYGVLKRDGTTDAFRDRMFDFAAINAIVETEATLERGRRYEGDGPAASRAGAL
jgi:2-methylisocitrate lyase-like PEP mutase family enzyme